MVERWKLVLTVRCRFCGRFLPAVDRLAVGGGSAHFACVAAAQVNVKKGA